MWDNIRDFFFSKKNHAIFLSLLDVMFVFYKKCFVLTVRMIIFGLKMYADFLCPLRSTEQIEHNIYANMM